MLMCMHTNIAYMGEDDSVNIRIKTDTWQRMQRLKDEPGKTWDDVIQELLEEATDDE